MFPHTVWTEGAQRAARGHNGDQTQQQSSNQSDFHRTADRLVPPHAVSTPRSVRRPPAASA